MPDLTLEVALQADSHLIRRHLEVTTGFHLVAAVLPGSRSETWWSFSDLAKELLVATDLVEPWLLHPARLGSRLGVLLLIAAATRGIDSFEAVPRHHHLVVEASLHATAGLEGALRGPAARPGAATHGEGLKVAAALLLKLSVVERMHSEKWLKAFKVKMLISIFVRAP